MSHRTKSVSRVGDARYAGMVPIRRPGKGWLVAVDAGRRTGAAAARQPPPLRHVGNLKVASGTGPRRDRLVSRYRWRASADRIHAPDSACVDLLGSLGLVAV
jgi:hypothetical protein